MAAGHSLGEYTALVAAGAISFADALPLVRLRAQAMQEAVPHGVGAMAAILGLNDEDVRAACKDSARGQICEPVNWNAPGQVVIAGHAERGRACDGRRKGARREAWRSAAGERTVSFVSLMKPAAARLRQALSKITVKPPRIPVIHNRRRRRPAPIRKAYERPWWRRRITPCAGWNA